MGKLRLHLTGSVIVLLALGLGLAEAIRAYLPRTRIGASMIGRVSSARAGDRIDRFGEARPIAPATAAQRERVDRTATTDLDDAIAAFGRGEDSPALLRLAGPSDLAQLARTSRGGELWLRLSDFDGWPDRGERRETLIEAVARHPEWGDEVVYEAAIALALWENDGGFGVNRARNRKRVRRLRAAASRDLVYLDEVRAERAAAAAERRTRGDDTAA